MRSTMSDGETTALQQLTDGRRAVEAGALLGYSALALAHTAARVVSIDRHEGYGPGTWRPYMSNLLRFGNLNIIRPLVGDALALLAQVAADIALIDLDGTEATTAHALDTLHTEVQFAAVHDFRRNGCAGVERAITRSRWQLVTVVDTLAILKGAQ